MHSCESDTSCLRWKQLSFNLCQDALESLMVSLQSAVCLALHVAVHTELHMTPAAYPLAVQFNQADDMQHDIPLKSALHAASLGVLVRGCVPTAGFLADLWSTNEIILWFKNNAFFLNNEVRCNTTLLKCSAYDGRKELNWKLPQLSEMEVSCIPTVDRAVNESHYHKSKSVRIQP